MKLPTLPEIDISRGDLYGYRDREMRAYGEACARAALKHAAEMLDEARKEAQSSTGDPHQDRYGYFDGMADLADEMADKISKMEIEK